MSGEKERGAELLAPAGSLQSVIAAVNAGADAVYMGGRKFGARAFAESAQAEETDMLLRAIEYCHLFDVKLYMTVNVLFKDSELKELFSYLKPYYEAGVDALIVQDLGAARQIQRWFPDLPLHASTQMTVTGAEGARLMKRLGMSRAVLARELSLPEIREIRESCDIELETFIHGAMCYSYSGACFMSSLLGGRSGNRGRCAGTCRLCYETAGKKGYYLSMKDMSAVELLPELLKAGAFSLKIEGRMKSPVYTAGVVSVYRKYLESALRGEKKYRVAEEDLLLLRELYDRGGTSEYLTRHNGREMLAIEEKPFRAVREELLREIERKYVLNSKTLPVRGELLLERDRPAVLTLSSGEDSVRAESEEPVSMAESRAAVLEEIERQLRKSGGTEFSVQELSIRMQEGLFVPVSLLNRLRRKALEMLKEAKLERKRRRQTAAG